MRMSVRFLWFPAAFAVLFTSCSRQEQVPGTLAPTPATTDRQDTESTSESSFDRTVGSTEASPPVPVSLADLEAQREQFDKDVWRQEVLAQEHERYFIALWDQLRASPAPEQVLANLPCDRIRFGSISQVSPLPHQIQQLEFTAADQSKSLPEWKALIQQFQQRGFRLVESEWHHSTFEMANETPESTFSFVLHLIRPLAASQADPNERQARTSAELLASSAPQQRILARGTLRVTWPASSSSDEASEIIAPVDLEVTKLTALVRTGPAAFREVLDIRRRENEVASAHPLLVYDLNADGLPEIILPRWNRIYANEGQGRFQEKRMVNAPLQTAECGVLADVDRDGRVDLITVDAKSKRPILLRSNSDGAFEPKPEVLADIELPLALAITAGDIDGDHDLDLWITQYKPSYLGGQMPYPYYDANDGEPSYLLINDGSGKFSDGTQAFNLAAKRHRRTYSTSFVDYDSDGDQDLVVVSDYAGVDLYENNGDTLIDVTAQQLPTEDLFGMAHTFADFDGDQQLDAYFIGMSSTTARRLDQMGLDDPRFEMREGVRTRMGFGNRMMLWKQNQFQEASFKNSVARTGWSWGTSNFDFDLDGDRDIYVGNGFRSGRSCQDYCTTFWRHDIYTGQMMQGQEHQEVAQLFTNLMGDLNTGATSWNGYEHNALLLNLDGNEFVNIGFLLGVGFEYDARCVVTTDLDNDGRPDLLVGRYRLIDGGYVLDIKGYQNVLDTGHHWIGVHLDDTRQPIGARIQVETASGTQTAWVVTGDSFLSQHPATVLWGLGQQDSVKRINVQWADGRTSMLESPTVDVYHRIR